MPESPETNIEPKKTLSDRIGAALPIALTAIATAFAGLSTSEMSQAMYWRSAAAQDQSKANDQWSFAGFKRDRSLIVQTTAAQLRAMSGYRPLNPAYVPPVTVNPEILEQITRWMASSEEKPESPPTADENIQHVLNAVHHRKSEQEIVLLARKINPKVLNAAINAAAQQSNTVDRAWDEENNSYQKLLRETTAAATKEGAVQPARIAEASVVQAALYEMDARRYRAESTMNFWVGFLYEVRVKTSTATSDRHRERSGNFFYAMLAAQIGATLASLGLARKHRSGIWLVAGIAGMVAVVFGVYVYLGM